MDGISFGNRRKKCPGNQSKQDGEISNIQGALKVRYNS